MQNIIQHAYFLPDIDLESVMEDLLQETSPELLLLDPATELYLDQDNDKKWEIETAMLCPLNRG